VIFPRRFFELNWLFALRVEVLSQRPLAGALLDHTHLYIRFDLGRGFDPTQSTWQEFLRGIDLSGDPIEWTYQFYLTHQAPDSQRPDEPMFGCFSYTVLPGQRIRLHFHNAETQDTSPLSQERLPARIAELTAMLTHIKAHVDQPTTLIGGSWLYNVDAYRRLFPPAYLASAHVAKDEFQYLTLWGQFLDRRGQVKAPLAVHFSECLNQTRDVSDLTNCFPFQVLHLESSIQQFYSFYGA
jgi:hypothetical protein